MFIQQTISLFINRMQAFVRNFLLKILGLLLILCCFNPTHAQTSSSYSIKAAATVIENAEIELITIKDFDIDESKAVLKKIHVSAKLDPQAGKMLVKGRPNTNIRIIYTPDMMLENSNGNGSLKFHYEVYGYAGDNQRASESIDAVDRIMKFNKQGHYYLWVGGSIDISNAQPGSYEGEFTLEIEYI